MIRAIIIIIIAAAIAVLLWFVGIPIYKDSLPSKERADLREYLGLSEREDAAVMLGEVRSVTDALVRGGTVYWGAASVRHNFTDKFWFNTEDGTLLYTTADEVVRTQAGESFYMRHAEAVPADGVVTEVIDTDAPMFLLDNGRVYIALDYAMQFSNFTYEFFKDPYRVQIYAEDDVFEGAEVIKNTSLRVDTHIKADVVTDLSEGDTVFVLDRLEGWTKVRTKDVLTGYVENKYLSEESFDVEISIPQTYVPSPYTDLVSDRRIMLAWHLVTVPDANENLERVIEPAWPLDVISPTWYSLIDETGAIESVARKSYVDRAHARGLKVWPMFDDFTSGPDRASRTAMLMSTESRNNTVSYLIHQAKELGFDGINLDFELVPLKASTGYEQLLRELSVACRAHGLVFSIDNYPPTPRTEHYNRRLQGEVADYVIIMGYDEHWSTSEVAGSVASLPFVRRAIEQTLKVVPARKVMNAVPFYTRIWSTDKEGKVSVIATPGHGWQDRWIAENNLEPEWDEEMGQDYAEMERNGNLIQVWLENEASMRVRMELMDSFDLGGVAAWQIGLEAPSIWNILSAFTRG